MNLKKIIEKTGLNPKTMSCADLIMIAKTKGYGLKSLHELVVNSNGNLTTEDYLKAREVLRARQFGKSSNKGS